MIKRVRSIGGVWRCRRGVAAIEFALIAPVMIFMYMGMAELSQGMTAQRRVSHAASALGDLVTQDSTITSANLDDVLNAATTIMLPFPASSLKLRITSITADANGVAKVDWSRGKNGMAALTVGGTATVPAGLLSAGESMVVAESGYTYTSPVTSVLPAPLTFSEKFYLKPRKGSKVTCTGC